MARYRSITAALATVMIAAICQAPAPAGPPQPMPLPKNERVGAWQPSDGGVQIPLWPAAFPLATPDSGDRPEGTGNGTRPVGGRRWHWASYVTRPTMTLYRPK